MLITHCMLCKNLMFWKEYCMIENTLNITIKRTMNTLLQKRMLHFLRTAVYFVRIPFLDSSSAFLQRRIAAYEWKVYFKSKTCDKVTLYIVDECCGEVGANHDGLPFTFFVIVVNHKSTAMINHSYWLSWCVYNPNNYDGLL